ncbi:MAG: hypothetical protein H0U54_10395 [Acidobacteria bacterium]|jgi:hypothetical protein|nr:hypothetical protein [Acidobacteriota bacterium]
MGISFIEPHKKTSLFIDDYLKAHPHCAQWRRSPHSEPRFSDAEVLTIALLQGSFQVTSLKHTYRLIRANFRQAFPRLPSSAEWLRRLHQLSIQVGLLPEATSASERRTAFYLWLIPNRFLCATNCDMDVCAC